MELIAVGRALALFLWIETLKNVHAKAGKYCSADYNCQQGLQVCKYGMCECFSGMRKSSIQLKLLEVCRTDTHLRNLNDRCIYPSQCRWIGDNVGCLSGMCKSCLPGQKLDSYGTYCTGKAIKISTAEKPLTPEERSKQMKLTTKKIITIAVSICVSLAVFGLCIAVCRIYFERRKRSDYPEHVYFQKNESNEPDEQNALPDVPSIESLGDISPLSSPPGYSEAFPSPSAPQADEVMRVNDPKPVGINQPNHVDLQVGPLSTPSSPAEENPWSRWLPPAEDRYNFNQRSPPPPYDLDKHFKKV